METKSRVIIISIIGIVLVVSIMIVAGRFLFFRDLKPAVERVAAELGAKSTSPASPTAQTTQQHAPASAAETISKKSFPTNSFTAVVVDGGWTLTVVKGTTPDVTVSAPSDVLSDLVVENGATGLHLGFSHGADIIRGSMTARIQTPALENVTLNGGVKAAINGFESDRLEITINGAGDVTGRSDSIGTLVIHAAGAANIDLSSSSTTNAEVYVDGAGNITLNMKGGTLGGRISGLGKVDYYGTVSEQTIAVAGLGSVKHKE